ncbi:transmembrane reductase CYB561D2-like [Harmonia axyridis]|uniref:transmembrane reductase CYB561D2-like n=1 Tax=Harmonia axyridis TaxID=115357 RepID=UPI001E275ABB|nr:transmembrane reductase CYB561D2-like [Harmonia axyridis]
MARTKFEVDVTNVVQIFEIAFVLMIFLMILGTEFQILNVHAFHFSVAWIISMTQGLLALHAVNPVVKKLLGKDKVFNHWVIETVGLVGSTLAFSCGYKDKTEKNEAHFQTWHAILGLLGYALSIFSGLNGIPALYRKELKAYVSPDWNKYFHIVTGSLGFFFGGLSLLASLYSNWYIKKTHASETSFILGLFLITSVVAWALVKPIGIVKSDWKRLISKKNK